MNNVLYVHGYKSKFDQNSIKVKTIQSLGNSVYGFDIDYDNESLTRIVKRAKELIIKESIDYVVGTSMGGYICSRLNVPYISLNPELNIKDYPIFKSSHTANLILLNKGDELFDSYSSQHDLSNLGITAVLIDGGDHRFSNINSPTVLELIKEFDHEIFFKNYNISEGIEND